MKELRTSLGAFFFPLNIPACTGKEPSNTTGSVSLHLPGVSAQGHLCGLLFQQRGNSLVALGVPAPHIYSEQLLLPSRLFNLNSLWNATSWTLLYYHRPIIIVLLRLLCSGKGSGMENRRLCLASQERRSIYQDLATLAVPQHRWPSDPEEWQAKLYSVSQVLKQQLRGKEERSRKRGSEAGFSWHGLSRTSVEPGLRWFFRWI